MTDLAHSLFGTPAPMETDPTPEEKQNLSLQTEYNKLLTEHSKIKDELENIKKAVDMCSEETRKEVFKKLGRV